MWDKILILCHFVETTQTVNIHMLTLPHNIFNIMVVYTFPSYMFSYSMHHLSEPMILSAHCVKLCGLDLFSIWNHRRFFHEGRLNRSSSSNREKQIIAWNKKKRQWSSNRKQKNVELGKKKDERFWLYCIFFVEERVSFLVI